MKILDKTRAHLKESNMTYGYHLRHSIKQSNRLFVLAVKSVVHGFFPWIWINSGPLGVYRIYKEIRNLQHVQKLTKRHEQNQPDSDSVS
jgi:hypothetical protein